MHHCVGDCTSHLSPHLITAETAADPALFENPQITKAAVAEATGDSASTGARWDGRARKQAGKKSKSIEQANKTAGMQAGEWRTKLRKPIRKQAIKQAIKPASQ